jgi:hypothetical protein
MKSNNNNNNDDDDDNGDNNNNNNNTAMGSVHARGDTFLTFGFKALTETNTSRLATGHSVWLGAGRPGDRRSIVTYIFMVFY